MEMVGDESRLGGEPVLEVRVTAPGAEAAPSEGGFELLAPTPYLGGNPRELLLAHLPDTDAPALRAESTGLWKWWRSRAVQLAAVRQRVEPGIPLEEQVAGLYRELLSHLGGNFLYRIWNYVPAINTWEGGQENYRRFNQGRAMAFQAYAGERGSASLPAASAVGAEGPDLVIHALSGQVQPVYFENPEQVPAYQYPEEYGPTPPSFARGSIVIQDGVRHGFISGTAAIKGHRSLAPGDLAGQVDVTLHNLRLMAERLDFPGALNGAAAPGLTRFLRVYLRHADQAMAALAHLRAGGLDLAPHEYTLVRADVCRAELDIEIEAKFSL
jgi:hypothetical protein